MKRMALDAQTYGAGMKTKKTTSFHQAQNDQWAASLFCDYDGALRP